MNLLALISLRAWLIIGATAAIVGLLWHDHYLGQRLKVRVAEVVRLSAELGAKERELKLQKEASNDYQQSRENLRTARADTPTRVVRLCKPAAAVLPGAAGGSAAAGEEAIPEAPRSDPGAGPDIGAELYGLADDADECAVQRDALIDWFSRTAARP